MTSITRNLGLAAMAMFAVVCFGVNPGWSGTDRLHERSPYVSSVVEIVTDSQGNTISGHYAKGPCFIGEYYSAPLTGPWGSSYIWKQDPDGNTLWVKQIAAAVIIDDLGTDADGNIYFMAKYLDAIVLEDNEFVPIDWCDYIIAKLNPQGEYQWITNVGYVDYMSDFCVGSDGSCFITGDLDHGFNCIGPFNMNDISNSEMFVAKLNASGTWQWAQRATGTRIVQGQIISPDNNGACYVLGKALGSLTIGSFYLPELGNSHMNFVAYYSPNGDVAWVKGLDPDSTPRTIVHDGQGNAYILSNYQQYPEEKTKVHMVNEDTEPTIVFSMPETGSIWGMGLKTDASGNFYLMGTYSLPFSLEGASFDAQHGVFF